MENAKCSSPHHHADHNVRGQPFFLTTSVPIFGYGGLIRKVDKNFVFILHYLRNVFYILLSLFFSSWFGSYFFLRNFRVFFFSAFLSGDKILHLTCWQLYFFLFSWKNLVIVVIQPNFCKYSGPGSMRFFICLSIVYSKLTFLTEQWI